MNPPAPLPDKITPDDPRLTAFALGELSGTEHAKLAAAVAADSALAAEVTNIRTLAGQMQAALAAEPAVSLPALSLPEVSPSKGSNSPAPAAAPQAHAAIISGKEWRKPDEALTREAQRRAKNILRFPVFYWLATAAAACFALLVWVKNPSAPAAPEKVAASRPQSAPATVETQVAVTPEPAPVQSPPNPSGPLLPPAPQVARVEPSPAPAAPTTSNGIDQPRYQPGVTVAADGIAALKDAVSTARPAAPVAPTPPSLTSVSSSSYDDARIITGGGGPVAGQSADRLDLPKTTAGTVTLAGGNTNTGGVGTLAPGAGAAPGVGGRATRGAGAGAAAGGRGGRGGAGGAVGGQASQGLAGNNFGGGFGPGAGAPAGSAGRGGGGGRRAAGAVTVTANAPVVVRVGYDPDAGYRYPLPAPDVIIRRPQPPTPAPREAGGEQYARLRDNPFTDPAREPFSTFSADVDTASYANIRRFLQGQNRLPPPDAVRIEEMVNYFPYTSSVSTTLPFRGDLSVGGGVLNRSAVSPPPPAPFTTAIESAPAPWLPSHRLVRVTLKARDVTPEQRGRANLVFLLDVSGSMDAANKLPLVKESMRLLLSRLRPDDRVAIVTYANGSGVALPPTPVERRTAILDAIDGLHAEGGTNGAAGIQLAYQVAQENLNKEGVNRVILCTDGDFNVGATGAALTQMVTERARGGVFLSVLGFGMNNLNDATLEQLADRGNGHYGYIDTRAEAQKLLVDQLSGTLVNMAKDVKFQVEFNPSRVAAYRLIGYEDRLLAAQDFNNDRVDAGEIGAGHTVTALYEIVPPGADYGYPTTPGTDAPRYTETTVPTRPADAPRPAAGANSPELLTVKVRYKQPTSDVSEKLEFPYTDSGVRFEQASADLRFAAAVAGFGMVLRESPYRGGTTLTDVLAWAEGALGQDPGGLRAEFTELVRRARELRREPVTGQPRPLNTPGVDAPRY